MAEDPNTTAPEQDDPLSEQPGTTDSTDDAGTGPVPVAPVGDGLADDWEPTDSVPAAEAANAIHQADDRFLRLAAEFDNYRKRTIREKTESFDRGAGALFGSLLDELDDVDRLYASDPATTDYQAFRDGFELFSKKLAKELANAGVERIDPVGEKFDPEEHEAVSILVPDDPADDDKVAATFQVGYRFRDKVIRHAKVQVWTVDGSI